MRGKGPEQRSVAPGNCVNNEYTEEGLSLLKEQVREALEKADFSTIVRLALENKRVFSILISLSYDKEDVICWRAIEALGKAAGAVAATEPASVRNVVQKLLWSLSEESGGIGWSAPEMLGEIVVNAPHLCADIPPIILSFYEEESFLKGILRAAGRIAECGITQGGAAEVAMRCLDHRDSSVRGFALYAVSKLKTPGAEERITSLFTDTGRFLFYEDHCLNEKIVGEFAREALQEFGRERLQQTGETKIPKVREEKDDASRCPFCKALFPIPEEIKTETGTFLGGQCNCGAVYACDPTGHNLGETYLDALIYASGGDWDVLNTPSPGEELEELILNYDLRTHRIWRLKDIRRDSSGKILFLKSRKIDK